MDNTIYFGLEKPSQEDFYDIEVQNRNMDIIDRVIKEHKHTLDDINGSVPIESGGTGASTLEQALENLGLSNAAKIETGTYQGNGSKDGVSLTFGFSPQIVILSNTTYYAIFVRGVESAVCFKVESDVHTASMEIYNVVNVYNAFFATANWDVESVLSFTYITDESSKILNDSGVSYNYIAIG